MKVRKAVIPAAGLGTRMLPATKTVPKEMLPLRARQCLLSPWRDIRRAGSSNDRPWAPGNYTQYRPLYCVCAQHIMTVL